MSRSWLSALTPFRSDDIGDLYDSYTARSTRTFGYTYPEIIDWDVSPDDLASTVRTQFNTLYGPVQSNSVKPRSLDSRPKWSNETRSDIDFDWYARFTVERCEAPSTFTVHVFLGPVPNDTSTWSYAPNLVGSHAFLMSSHRNVTASGPRRGQIPLNKKLEHAGVPCRSPGTVLQHVGSSLTWALQYLDGTTVDISTMPSFRFFVSQQTIKPAKCTEDFPTYMGSVSHNISTFGYA